VEPEAFCQPSSDVARDFDVLAIFRLDPASLLLFSVGTADVGARPRAPGRAMPPSETFVALQRLAKKRRGDPPGAPGGPGPAAASEARSEKREVPAGTGATPEDAAEDAPLRLAAVTARALAHLPRFEDVVSRYRLFRGDDTDAETGRRCSPETAHEGDAAGEMTCRCGDCARWRRVVAGAPGEPPFWVSDPEGEKNTRTRKPKKPRKPMYEVFTREHVAGLAAYFRARAAKRLGAEASTRSLRVLELGAGSGVLSRALAAATRAMDAAGRVNGERTAACSVTYHATDDYSFRERTKASREPNDEDDDDDEDDEDDDETVRAADYRVALRDAAVCDGSPPDVVLICWHPIREDWTRAVRLTPSVFEYVLVGETDFGACGHPAETWGLSGDALSDELEEDELSDELERHEWQPPHEADGFERVDLDALSKHQVCRTDEPWLKARRSGTVSFRRRREASSAYT
jgi:hypothetical protein